jgi:hypothetical protein
MNKRLLIFGVPMVVFMGALMAGVLVFYTGSLIAAGSGIRVSDRRRQGAEKGRSAAACGHRPVR